jgi:hypothetical protein
MQTKRPTEQQEEERDIELENIVGNLMIAEYQVDILRTRLGDRARLKDHQNSRKKKRGI